MWLNLMAPSRWAIICAYADGKVVKAKLLTTQDELSESLLDLDPGPTDWDSQR